MSVKVERAGFKLTKKRVSERKRIQLRKKHIRSADSIDQPLEDNSKLNQSLASRNASQRLHMDSNQEQETAHIHIFTVNPCQNDATLSYTLSGAHCACKPGFKGTYCQDKDHCFSRPCYNNGTCLNRKTRYECLCKDGFKGINCEIRDMCFPNPCLNDGVCLDQNGVFQCSCQRGFKGVNCADANKCEMNPCKNGGTCLVLEGDEFFCSCLPEYIGSLCQSRYRCFLNPCRNGGTCVNDERKPICQCHEGYIADYCQDHVCIPNPCLHGGICSAARTANGWGFHCTCPQSFKGDKCEVPQPCAAHPCLYGRCIDATNHPSYERLSDTYLCLCDKGYTGKNCQKNICVSCDVNAKCISGQCVCNDGYLGNGLSCTLSANSGLCSIKPCLNNGTCIDLDGRTYECRCTEGYEGPRCETQLKCIPNPCKNGGLCYESGNSFRCVCPHQFRETDCSEVVMQDKCSPNPCKNGGICRTSEDGQQAFCKCPSFKFKAPFCDCVCPKADVQKQKYSSDSFCDKSGDCVCPRSDMYLTPWGCVPALIMDNPCSLRPCKNNATCYNLSTSLVVQSDRSYGCRCAFGFTGSHCETKLPNPCLNNPCQNNGTCKESNGIAVCFCKSGFVPPYCLRPEPGVSKCFPNPCLNEGECFEEGDHYNCTCKKGFMGTHCQATVDDCKGCNDTNTYCLRGKCVCKPGFVGDGKFCVPILKGAKVSRHPTIYVARRSKLVKGKSEKKEKRIQNRRNYQPVAKYY